MITDKLLRALPKTDLHVHLDGSLRLSSLIEMAKEQGVVLPSYTEEGLNELVFKANYANLIEYLAGFSYTTAILQDAESLERAAYELAWDNIDEGVCYIEARFAPQLHAHDDLTLQDVLVAVDRGLARAGREYEASADVRTHKKPPFRYGIIVCALRMFRAEFSAYYRKLCEALSGMPDTRLYGIASLELARAAVQARDALGLPIVGFDLAGQEDGFPAIDHDEAYQFAHENFMCKTVHAGEAYGPESIFQAITSLNADRVGHGYHLFSPELVRLDLDSSQYCEDLAGFIADRRVTIEVCITSNLQTNPSIGSIENHAFKKMLDHNLSATLCTDNRLVSHTSVCNELRLAIDAFDMSRKDLRNTIIYGFKRSFFPEEYTKKRNYVRQVIDHYDDVCREHDAR
jgi:adenosine deaminase